MADTSTASPGALCWASQRMELSKLQVLARRTSNVLQRHVADAPLEHVTCVKRAAAASTSSSSAGRDMVDNRSMFDDPLAGIAKLTDCVSEAVAGIEMLELERCPTRGEPCQSCVRHFSGWWHEILIGCLAMGGVSALPRIAEAPPWAQARDVPLPVESIGCLILFSFTHVRCQFLAVESYSLCVRRRPSDVSRHN